MPDMRYAPPPSLRIADKSGGLNQISVRSFNERLIMSLLLQNKHMSRLDLGKRSGLSAQTISVIVRSLEQDGLLIRGEAQRGRVGPPTIPMSLNPDGALSLGVSIGSRATNIVLIDFIGNIRFQETFYYQTPELNEIKAALQKALPNAIKMLEPELRDRIIGIGTSLPDTMSIGTGEVINVNGDSSWGQFDFENFLNNMTGLEVFIQNDITAAVGAESVFGLTKSLDDYLFFFLGARSHSRLILKHRIYAGQAPVQEVSRLPGLLELEELIDTQGGDSKQLWKQEWDRSTFGDEFENWISRSSESLAIATDELCRFIDVKTIVVGGTTPISILKEICSDFEKKLSGKKIITASVGPLSKAIGGASLPFISRFMVQDGD